MGNEPPKVSIGLPVYNGEKYLEEALTSVINQTFTDFEVILSDNASTDRTPEICKEYAARDPRIHYYRNATNIGGGNNETRTAQLANGEYFCWLGHDDKYAPEFLESCVEVLDNNPNIVHCYAEMVSMDENGRQIGITSRNHATSPKTYQRFITIACAKDFCEESNGLTRSVVLKKTPLVLNYTASDRTLLAEISLYGQFCQVDKPLFFKRFHPGNVYLDWRARMAWFNPDMGGKIVFPFWIQFFDYLKRISHAQIPLNQKISCLFFMYKWILVYGKSLVKDLLYGFYMLLHSYEWRRKRYEHFKNWG
jgi:glycosyltransferase involved in cell wall biosynthesis